ncbi:mandelate racemase/muconate lactonizing enzyme family protein [Anaerotruncus rubiinfantis]|uniref:mandelate racemase/muconate lactonizing enzyme family protein n=1 Tax=Anaerotruncus rubiinfantis TaxID=1720200 RepID=UPI000832AED7|nr:mandelate racemase/muconate lactonizing enzyme family protein [Anaerotruncus rubiinfantis]
MKIQQINVYPLNATWVKYYGGEDKVPEFLFRPSSNFAYNPRKGQHTTLVEIISEDGVKGYGECFGIPDAVYSANYVKDIMAPILLGREASNIVQLWNIMMHVAAGIGNSSGPMMEAISGIDTALWDLKGKSLGVPVYDLLGGKLQEKIYCYSTPISHFKTVEETRAKTKELLDMGFTAVKLKVGRGIDTDLRHVAAVRDEAGPDVKLLLDNNCGYEGKVWQAIDFAKQAEAYGIYWFEEPVSPENLDAYKLIKSHINLPMATGENNFTFSSFKRLIDSGTIDIIMPNLGRAGGISGVHQINNYAQARGVQLSPHGVGSGVSILAALHLMTPFQNALLFEYNQLLNPLRHGIMHNKIPYSQSYIQLNSDPGLGVQINWETVDKYLDDQWKAANC